MVDKKEFEKNIAGIWNNSFIALFILYSFCLSIYAYYNDPLKGVSHEF